MQKLTFILTWLIGAFTFSVNGLVANAQNYQEDFEAEFETQNYPEEFLAHWYGNEVQSGSSRIFQAEAAGVGSSQALAVQPISTFDGELIVRLFPSDYVDPNIQFWARSLQNGSGDRAAVVSYSFSESLEGNYGEESGLGSEEEFANEDQDYRKFEINLSENQQRKDTLFLKISVRYGAGSGTCARWLMDDFVFGDIEEDKEPPRVERVRGFDANQLELQFSERLDPIFSQIQLNFGLDGDEPIDAELKLDSLVILTFGKDLEESEDYSLSIRQISDLEGNVIKDTTVNFQFFDPTEIAFKDLVINEIMPAPREENALPNVEYVELLHRGEKEIRTGQLLWSNSRISVELEDFWIQPGEFVLLVPEDDAELMEEFGLLIPISSWPTLLNGGDELKLESDNEDLIDQISYSTASWGSSEFSGGGYSLEVVNPDLLCDQSLNLRPSENPNRGSPGSENSVFDSSLDTTAPRFEEYFFTKANELRIRFSELIQPFFTQNQVSFESQLEVDSIWIEQDLLRVNVSETFPENELIRVSIEGFLDCSGNEMNLLELDIIRPSIAQAGEIFLNELLYNPKTGSPKFVELINPTDKFLEIGSWSLANLDDQENIDQLRMLSEESLVMEPNSFLAISTDTNGVKLDYPLSEGGKFYEISSLPSYPIAGGTVLLLDSEENVVEQFSYVDDLHHPLLQDSKGVSLERVSIETSADILDNWHSASSAVGYASPGMKNSQFIPEEFDSEIIQIDPAAFDPEGSNGNTFVSIRYELEQPGWVGSFRIYDLAGRRLASLAENEILATKGLYTWTGTDNLGRRMRSGYYVLLVELFDLDGRQKTIRKTIIIAERL
ncbi:lamin tail domain-containing protein [Algoriphagus hitonicola]|uniref:Lamin Tail Domain n=1 Tax=Algoriphagus hitonicola TaxID=435880 RepID=A0A1I2W5H6_9BACT|nr:lamin tail domain-containing protein [Algoriphagus hitonicola]SFG96655.1 Lamin Tail Domain [Algoriphagus hitonicola]